MWAKHNVFNFDFDHNRPVVALEATLQYSINLQILSTSVEYNVIYFAYGRRQKGSFCKWSLEMISIIRFRWPLFGCESVTCSLQYIHSFQRKLPTETNEIDRRNYDKTEKKLIVCSRSDNAKSLNTHNKFICTSTHACIAAAPLYLYTLCVAQDRTHMIRSVGLPCVEREIFERQINR